MTQDLITAFIANPAHLNSIHIPLFHIYRIYPISVYNLGLYLVHSQYPRRHTRFNSIAISNPQLIPVLSHFLRISSVPIPELIPHFIFGDLNLYLKQSILVLQTCIIVIILFFYAQYEKLEKSISRLSVQTFSMGSTN